MGMSFVGTFLQAAKTKKNIDEAKKRQQQLNMKKSGSIERNYLKKNVSSMQLKPTVSDIQHTEPPKKEIQKSDNINEDIRAFIIPEGEEGEMSRTDKEMLQLGQNIFNLGKERGPEIRKPKK